jgi:hypothetical protein
MAATATTSASNHSRSPPSLLQRVQELRALGSSARTARLAAEVGTKQAPAVLIPTA